MAQATLIPPLMAPIGITFIALVAILITYFLLLFACCISVSFHNYQFLEGLGLYLS